MCGSHCVATLLRSFTASTHRCLICACDLAGMKSASEVRHASLARDAAARRLRRVTQLAVAVMVALGGAFTALAAGSTHARKTVVRAPLRHAAAVVVAQAPAPPLVTAQSSAPDSSSAQAAAAPAPPAAAPVPSYSPPVAVSGGS
jgi:hypothetical protein